MKNEMERVREREKNHGNEGKEEYMKKKSLNRHGIRPNESSLRIQQKRCEKKKRNEAHMKKVVNEYAVQMSRLGILLAN
jgi:hypothetical protein